ncbi:MAG TPA: cysteine--tRNA ligase [Acidimicrobiales bacterium]|jgi:L-cysteine:1D-myo-inositol 2-amino-2-deoxy-alpha-D-glucopyranoside ligase|nr:cysteine--tRNA ligase [Acidimicrobiales bacterium]
MRLYDTARRSVVPFEPGPVVRMYVCGITPYDATHLGHAATYLSYDLLVRHLEHRGHTVELVRNITDVDDSILPKARSLGVDFRELADAETARFHRDMEALDTRPPVAEPRVTESIDPIIELITVLAAAGHTYTVEGTTYFDVSSCPPYGVLSRFTRAEMIDLARDRGGHPDDPRQRDALDFVLWQPSLDDEPSWPSPFGPGRPGWHVECSAMARSAFGTTLDLHGGGSDLIFPHHECEIAQSECAHGMPFVRHWMHCGLVAYQGTKMSKSLGNLVFVSELLKSTDPRAVRLSLMAHHYRDDWEWFDTDVEDGNTALATLHAAAQRAAGPDPAPYAQRFDAALDDDLDAPRARAIIEDLAAGILHAHGEHPAAPRALIALASRCGIDVRRPIVGNE